MSEGTRGYRILRFLATALVRRYFRCEAEGLEHVPAAGAFILAANHASYLDPFFIGAFCPRAVHYIMLRSYYEMPVIGWICRRAGSFPVDPEGPAVPALRRALRILQEGKALGIFPEGGRSGDGTIGAARGGVALLVLRSGYPLIPAAIIGAEKAFGKGMILPRPYRVRVRFGPPLSPPERKGGELRSDYLGRISIMVMEAIADLRRE